jgi:hypothetical protein
MMERANEMAAAALARQAAAEARLQAAESEAHRATMRQVEASGDDRGAHDRFPPEPPAVASSARQEHPAGG